MISQTLVAVEVDYNQLFNGYDISREIDEAYGMNGLGLLVVTNVPDVAKIREELLQCSFDIAHFPEDVLKKYEDPKSFFSYGWSHGKEKMSNGKFDFANFKYYLPKMISNLHFIIARTKVGESYRSCVLH